MGGKIKSTSQIAWRLEVTRAVFVSVGCRERASQTGWLKQQTCVGLQFWKLELRAQHSWFLLRLRGRACSGPLSQLLPASGVPGLAPGVLPVSSSFFRVCISLSTSRLLLSVRTRSYWIRPPPRDLVLT